MANQGFRNMAALAGLAMVLILSWAPAALAGRTVTPPPMLSLEEGQTEAKREAMALPYFFKAESLDWAFGVAGGATGYGQPQLGMFGAVMATTNGSNGVYLVGWNAQIPYLERFFLDYNVSYGRYTKQRLYVEDGNPGFPDERAGTNKSQSDDYLEGEGENNWAQFRFRYVLPTGRARNNPITTYYLKHGLLVSEPSGGRTWNPMSSGITTLEARTFWQEKSLDIRNQSGMRRTSGAEFALVHNNTDFPTNPAEGSVQRLAVTRDFGLLDSSSTWTTVEAEYSKYFNLDMARSWFKQTVLAFNVWTIDTPTWDEQDGRIDSRPPSYLGATLGGFWRMRGYPQGRFNDKSAIYYTAELRAMPQWQPIPKIDWLKYFKIDWWQFVLFAEAGRVADDWDLAELNSDLHYDGGVSLRLMAIKAVVRLDAAFCEEGLGIWAMVGHPF